MLQRRTDQQGVGRTSCRKFLCALASLWLTNFGALAQSDSSRTLQPVSVFATWDSIPRISVFASSVPHFRLTETKLNDLAVIDLGSAMKFVPGVQLKDYGGIGGIKTVSFRSMGATHTGVTIDGIKIPSVQSGSVNLSSFEIFGVDELAFSTGQFQENTASASSYLNANSISVQSVLVKKPEKINLRLYTHASSIASFEEGLLIQIPMSENSFFGAQAMTKFGQGNYWYTYDSGGITAPVRRANSELFSYKLRAVAGFHFSKSQTTFSANYYNCRQELPGAIILYNSYNDQQMWNEDFRFSVVHGQRINKTVLNAHAFYQSAWMRYYDPSFLNLQGFMDDTYRQQNFGGGFMYNAPFIGEKIKFFAGSDLIFSTLTGSSLMLAPSRIEFNSVIGASSYFKRFWLQSNLTIQLISDANSIGSAGSNKFKEWSPFVSVAWMPFKTSAFKLRAFYKRAFTMPSFNDLYYNFIGNSQLKPETANMLNAGFTWAYAKQKWRAEVSCDAFYNRIENKIIAIPTKDLFNWSMQNIGMIDARGIDAAVLINYKYKNWKFTTNLSYTYNLSWDISDNESATYQHQIPYTPFHSATGGICTEYAGYRLNLNLLYTGFRYSLNENIYANYLEPFTDFSVNLSKEFTMKKKLSFNVMVAVQNILNKNYEVIRSFPMPGRYYQLTLTILK